MKKKRLNNENSGGTGARAASRETKKILTKTKENN